MLSDLGPPPGRNGPGSSWVNVTRSPSGPRTRDRNTALGYTALGSGTVGERRHRLEPVVGRYTHHPAAGLVPGHHEQEHPPGLGTVDLVLPEPTVLNPRVESLELVRRDRHLDPGSLGVGQRRRVGRVESEHVLTLLAVGPGG